ncbi:hypothetical protein H5410_061527 [Solanum commersonii]|uniref:Uncharacterized protein n=1 Tax=Solanum commersonii TaxID=4109 RepID=A0A9J5W8A4_SOLCO|nr:hypothetical protein H5410_061527 [Solanum commersonii]
MSRCVGERLRSKTCINSHIVSSPINFYQSSLHCSHLQFFGYCQLD